MKKYNQLRAENEKDILTKKIHLSTKKFVMFCCKLLLDYVYDYYEKGRRQALATMFNSLEKSLKYENPDKFFREEVSNFLKRTYSKQLVNIANTKNLSDMMDQIRELIEGSNDPEILIKPVSDMKSLFGQTSRTLEDFPESLGLFFLRAYTRAKINDNDSKFILQDIEQFLTLSLDKYNFSKNDIYSLLGWLFHKVIEIDEKRGLELCKRVIDKIDDNELTEKLVEYLGSRDISLEYGKFILINKIYKELENEIYVEK